MADTIRYQYFVIQVLFLLFYLTETEILLVDCPLWLEINITYGLLPVPLYISTEVKSLHMYVKRKAAWSFYSTFQLFQHNRIDCYFGENVESDIEDHICFFAFSGCVTKI